MNAKSIYNSRKSKSKERLVKRKPRNLKYLVPNKYWSCNSVEIGQAFNGESCAGIVHKTVIMQKTMAT